MLADAFDRSLQHFEDLEPAGSKVTLRLQVNGQLRPGLSERLVCII